LVQLHIAQEALSNVVKHSRASRVEVHLTREDGGVVLSLSDNGRGFVETEVEQRMGHGLVNMRDRAHSVGGSPTLRPAAAGGTEVVVTIPAPSL
jgi:two-component system sensor histidine kinase UhpB